MVNFVRVQRSCLQPGEADDDFENRTGRVIFLHGPIDLRAQNRIVQFRGFGSFLGQPHGEIVWIVCRIGGHRDQVPVARVHNDHRASDRTSVGNRRRAQGFFSRLLDGDVNGQVNALTGLGRGPDVF